MSKVGKINAKDMLDDEIARIQSLIIWLQQSELNLKKLKSRLVNEENFETQGRESVADKQNGSIKS